MGALSRRSLTPARAAVICAILCVAGCAGTGIAAAEPPPVKRVLLLHQELGSRPFRARFNATFVDTIRGESAVPVDIYEEAIEPERFGTGDQPRLITTYLKDKYAGHPIDVLVVVGNRALEFARANRAIFGNPVIIAFVTKPGEFAVQDNVTGLQGGGWIQGTLDLALTLRPLTRRVVVIDGSRSNNGEIQAVIERQLSTRRGLELAYLRDLPLDKLLEQISGIPEQSIVLFVRQTIRNETQDLDPFEGLSHVVRVSPAPVFSHQQEYLGRGVVGGYMWRFEDDARRMATMAKQIVAGAPAADVAPGTSTHARMLDWNQLQRWNIPQGLVPAGSMVRSGPWSFFEDHKEYVVAGLLIFTAQVGLIVSLLAQRIRRRRAEEETRSSEIRYRSVVDTQSELICRFLPDTTLTFVNDAYCRFWNRTREQLIGTRFTELIPADARAAVLMRIADLRSGVDAHEHAVVLADGTVGWHQWTNHAIVDDRGHLVELQGVGRDITDQKRAQDALVQLEARNSAMLRAIPDLMFVVLRDGTYVDYHARDPRLLFVPPEQFIGRTVRDIMPPPQADLLMDAIERAGESDDPVVVEFDLPMEEPRYFEARLVRIEHGRILSIVRDVTESKQAMEVNRSLAGRLIRQPGGRACADRPRPARRRLPGNGQPDGRFELPPPEERRRAEYRLPGAAALGRARVGQRRRKPPAPVARPASGRAEPHGAGRRAAGRLRRS